MSADQVAEKVTTVLNGIPLCTKDDCPQYDGKRCQLSGSRPGHVCEPAVGEMAAELARLTSLLEEARGFAEASMWDADGEMDREQWEELHERLNPETA